MFGYFEVFIFAFMINAVTCGFSLLIMRFVKDCWGLAGAVVMSMLFRVFIISGGAAIVLCFFDIPVVAFLCMLFCFYFIVLLIETFSSLGKIKQVEFPEGSLNFVE